MLIIHHRKCVKVTVTQIPSKIFSTHQSDCYQIWVATLSWGRDVSYIAEVMWIT